jgi:hypothetical protein
MQAFIQSNQINFQEFHTLMLRYDALLAGSSALWVYLKENDIEPTFQPGDIDLWLNAETPSLPFKAFFESQGFTEIDQLKNLCEVQRDYDHKHIQYISTYTNPAGKKVQLISVDLVEHHRLHLYIQSVFDLSCCISWWNPLHNIVETWFPDTTLFMQMFVTDPIVRNPNKLQERIAKYQSRGFTLCEIPPPPSSEPDLRLFLRNGTSKQVGCSAFDVWEYDDVDCCDFLKQSSWHCLINTGTQLQAFHRKNLQVYMETRKTMLARYGIVYDTPNNQSITEEAYRVLGFSDYTVFELEFVESVVKGQQTKSLCSLKCYTIEGWNTGSVARTCRPLLEANDADYEEMPALVEAEVEADDLPLGPPALIRQNAYHIANQNNYIQQFYNLLMNHMYMGNIEDPAILAQDDQEFLLEYILGLNENV